MPDASSAWTRDEVELIVADYFAMLQAELSGQPVNKAERNRRLQQQIHRSKGSIEFKHANISAVLLHLGDPRRMTGETRAGRDPSHGSRPILATALSRRRSVGRGHSVSATPREATRPDHTIVLLQNVFDELRRRAPSVP
jgi:hypothetical protein